MTLDASGATHPTIARRPRAERDLLADAGQPRPAEAAARLLLATMTAGAPSGCCVELRAKRPTGGRECEFFAMRDLAAATVRAVELGASRDVYAGVLPRARQAGTGDAGRCGRALWADCDTPAAVQALDAFAWASGLIVSTSPGHLHAYWRLRDWIAPDLIEQGCRRLAHYLGSDLNVCDRARILRVPGTLNHKRGGQLVRLVHVATVGPLPTWSQLVGDERDGGPLPDQGCQCPPFTPAPRLPATIALDPGRDPVLDRAADVLRSLPASVYVPVLSGQAIDRDSKVRCPLHAGGQERTPSLHVYPGGRGWACFGCQPPLGRDHLGGDALALAGLLWGLTQRRDFPALVRRLSAVLAGEARAAI